jgi:DNA-binding NtrC family response regulator
MKSIKPRMPAVFCSGYDPQMAQVGFVVDEKLPLLQKPFDPERLLETIREALDEAPCPVMN